MKRLFGKLKETVTGKRLGDSLARTRQKLSDNVQRVLGGRTRIDEDTFEELEEILITADVGVSATEKLLDRLRERIQEQGVADGDSVHDVFVEEVVDVLRGAEAEESATEVDGPRVVLLVGVNGSGTSIVAAEKIDRRCLAIELDPHFADVVLTRWEELTGSKAVQLG